MEIWDIIRENEMAANNAETNYIVSVREQLNKWKNVLAHENSQENIREAKK